MKKAIFFVLIAVLCQGFLGPFDGSSFPSRDLSSPPVSRSEGQVRQRTRINWQQKYNEYDQLIKSQMDEPRGMPSDIAIYLHWLDVKAVVRNEVKALFSEAMNVSTGDPDWALKFDKLLQEAQRSGEGTAWDAAYKFLRIKMNQGWNRVLGNIQQFGRPLYTKTAETAFDPVFIRDNWVNCMINYCINNVEAGSEDIALYQGQQAVLADWGEDGMMQIPTRNFDTLCERRINFHIEDKGEPQVPMDKGLEWVEKIRKECDWWGFGKERTDATNLMEQYYKDDLCLYPNDKSHKWFKEQAEKYHLSEGIEYNEGFYAKLKGQVWLEEGGKKKPAPGAHVTVIDPKDQTKWEADAGSDGKYEIKRALLHVPKNGKGWPLCPKFKISAEYEGDRVDDTYEGPLSKPDRNAEHTKDLTIRPRDRWDVELTFTKTSAGKEDFGPGLTRELGWNYSATVKGVVEYVRSSGSDRIFESKSMDLDFNDSFWHHIVLKSKDYTCEGRLSWTATHNGPIQIPLRMIIHTRANRCRFGFGRREGDPIIFKIGINLWGDTEVCGPLKAWQGQSEAKDVLFDASGTDLDHVGKPIPFQPGQKVVTGQDQWTSKFWRRFYQVGVPIGASEFSDLSRGMLALLLNYTMMSAKVPSDTTLTWKATKLGQ